jgi:hypothetical protein
MCRRAVMTTCHRTGSTAAPKMLVFQSTGGGIDVHRNRLSVVKRSEPIGTARAERFRAENALHREAVELLAQAEADVEELSRDVAARITEILELVLVAGSGYHRDTRK